MNNLTVETGANESLMDPEGEFLTTREAAERLGVALRTAQLWVESGALPAWKTVGGHRRIPAAAVDAMRASRVVSRPRHDAPPEPFRLLAVEDDAMILKLFHLMVSSWELPLELKLAHDGFEALPLVASWRPHLLVTDLFMPGMDGFRMIRSLRDNPDNAALEIVVVSGLTAGEIEEKGGLPKGVLLLPKPVPFEKLEALVRTRLAERAGHEPMRKSA